MLEQALLSNTAKDYVARVQGADIEHEIMNSVRTSQTYKLAVNKKVSAYLDLFSIVN